MVAVVCILNDVLRCLLLYFCIRYGHYFVGSGSFISTGNKLEDDTLELRHFTPEEIARLLCFPQKFSKTYNRF